MSARQHTIPQGLSDPLLPLRLVFWTVLARPFVTFSADPDLWGHVRFGIDILRERAIAVTDRYSFTSDIPWVNHEWLAEAMMGFSYALGGSLGLSILRVVLLAGVIWTVACHLRTTRLPQIVFDGLLALLVVGTATQITTLRPQLWSLLLFAALLRRLSRGASLGNAGALAVVMALWVNVHGGWIVGVGTLVVWGVVRAVASREVSRSGARELGLTIGPSLLVLLNPYGLGILAFIYETVELGRVGVTEWQPVVSSGDPTAVSRWVLLLVFSLASIVKLKRGDLPRLAVVCLFAFASFRVQRLMSFFAVSAVMLLGPRWVPAVQSATPLEWTSRQRAAALAGAVALSVALILPRIAAMNCISLPERVDWLPDQRGVMVLKSVGATGRIFTWFNYGEYAIWHLSPDLRVSMDGRRETVYSESVLTRHFDAYHDREGGADYFRDLAPDFVWLDATLALAKRLKHEGWTVLAESERSVVLAKPQWRARHLPQPLSNGGTEGCFP